jgi:hypothetical protein
MRKAEIDWHVMIMIILTLAIVISLFLIYKSVFS